MQLVISFLLAKFACFSLSVKFSNFNLFNSWLVTWSVSWSVVTLFLISLMSVLQSVFVTKLLTLGILFSTAVRAVVVAKLVILGISLLNSFILTLKKH